MKGFSPQNIFWVGNLLKPFSFLRLSLSKSLTKLNILGSLFVTPDLTIETLWKTETV